MANGIQFNWNAAINGANGRALAKPEPATGLHPDKPLLPALTAASHHCIADSRTRRYASYQWTIGFSDVAPPQHQHWYWLTRGVPLELGGSKRMYDDCVWPPLAAQQIAKSDHIITESVTAVASKFVKDRIAAQAPTVNIMHQWAKQICADKRVPFRFLIELGVVPDIERTVKGEQYSRASHVLRRVLDWMGMNEPGSAARHHIQEQLQSLADAYLKRGGSLSVPIS